MNASPLLFPFRGESIDRLFAGARVQRRESESGPDKSVQPRQEELEQRLSKRQHTSSSSASRFKTVVVSASVSSALPATVTMTTTTTVLSAMPTTAVQWTAADELIRAIPAPLLLFDPASCSTATLSGTATRQQDGSSTTCAGLALKAMYGWQAAAPFLLVGCVGICCASFAHTSIVYADDLFI